MGNPEIRDLYSWKKAVCPSCDYSEICDKNKQNLRDCLSEEKEEHPPSSITGFLRKVVRHYTALNRYGVVGRLSRSIAPTATVNKVDKKATLECSDIEEFVNVSGISKNKQQY